jgi:uncharacterized integral membrane protein (TIGR00698 family)
MQIDNSVKTNAGEAAGYTLLVLPGLMVASLTAIASMIVAKSVTTYGVSPLIIAFAIGLVAAPTMRKFQSSQAGFRVGSKLVLRLGIGVLGFTTAPSDIMGLGLLPIAAVCIITLTTFLTIRTLGRFAGIDSNTSTLLAAGIAVCGASAIVAVAAAIKAKPQQVGYAVATITLVGTVCMFAYPFVASLVGLTDDAYGYWVGATLHEVAQVVVAGLALGPKAGSVAAATKMCRVTLLGVITVIVSILERPEGKEDRYSMLSLLRLSLPWYVLMFAAGVAINMVLPLPAETKDILRTVATFCLATGLAGIGFGTHLQEIKSMGPAPMLLASLTSIAMAATVLGAIMILW